MDAFLRRNVNRRTLVQGAAVSMGAITLGVGATTYRIPLVGAEGASFDAAACY